MKKIVAFLLVLANSAFAQTGSEIFLFDIKKSNTGLQLSSPENITQHPGYDNQPSFDRKGNIFYASFNADGRSDIRFYDSKKKIIKNITTTPEREYSPTLTPDKKSISCIIQRDNGAQDLGAYAIKGGSATVLIDDVTVGYHAWIDEDRVLIFVLGEPNTLQVYNVKTKERKIVASNVGRSLHQVPGEYAMSFVQKSNEKPWQVMRYDIATGRITAIDEVLPKREDMAWLPDGTVVMSDGEVIFYRAKGSSDWKKFNLMGDATLGKGITRLAVNTTGTMLAVVVAEE